MSGFHFLYPHGLWLLLLLPLLWAWVWRQRKNQSGWSGVVDPALAPFVLTGRERRKSLLPLLAFSLLAIVGILALAGPAWVKKEVPVFREQQPLVVAMDLSSSMYVQDVSPSRLEQARFKLIDLLQTRKGGQTGLVVFAGDAFAVSPLTDDVKTIEAQMRNLTPEIMPVQGSFLSLAIARSVTLLEQAGAKAGNILLMADGLSDSAQAQEAALAAVSKGFAVSVLGFGTEAGAPIPLREGGFLTDAKGQVVVPQLNPASLTALAQAGNGVFVQAGIGDQDINRLSAQWAARSADSALLAGGNRQVDTWVNEGIWLVLLLLPLVAVLFRRGWLAVFALVMILPPGGDVQAAGWADLWQTHDQQAQAALQAGQAKEASQLFVNPDWKAAAAYRSGDYTQAETLYANSTSPDGLYNYGNALAQQGKLAEAIAAYERVLALDPKHEDARYNRDLLKKQLENQQQQAGGQSQQQNQQQNQQNQQGQQDQQNQQQGAADPQQSPATAENQPQDQQEQPAAGQEEQEQDDKQQQEQGKDGKDGDGQEEQPAEPPPAQDGEQAREQKQAAEQWLRRIPDDPSGLWRRKFQYQYKNQDQNQYPQGARPAAGGEAW